MPLLCLRHCLFLVSLVTLPFFLSPFSPRPLVQGSPVGIRSPLGPVSPISPRLQGPRSPALRLSPQLEVSQLEGSLQQPKAQSAMSPYLVPDTQALCHHLPVIRQLATSGRFIVIIPRTGRPVMQVVGQSVATWDFGFTTETLAGPRLHTVALVQRCRSSEAQPLQLRNVCDSLCETLTHETVGRNRREKSK